MYDEASLSEKVILKKNSTLLIFLVRNVHKGFRNLRLCVF